MSLEKAKKAMAKPVETAHPRHEIDNLRQAMKHTIKACTIMNDKLEELNRKMRCVEMSTT